MLWVSYVTRANEVLDRICFEHYGNETMLEAVLEFNRGLAQLGGYLPVGVEIKLPTLTQESTEIAQTLRLWD